MIEKSKEQQITIPEPEINKNAEKTAEVFNSREYQRRLRNEVNRLKAKFTPQSSPEQKKSIQNQNVNSFLLRNERIYLFISSSIPIPTLKNYAADLDCLKDPNISMVMRGFVDGVRYIKPTLEFIETILTKDPDCDPLNQRCDAYQIDVSIDPMLFSRYGIQSVPAIVYARGVGTSEDQNDKGADVFMVSGDMALEYALDEIGKKSKSSQIENLVQKLRRGFY